MKYGFFGGVHPPERKELSLGGAVERVIPRQVALPLLQHIGAPCCSVVEVGQRVAIGQVVGEGEGLCAPVHASVSGTVRAIEPRPHVGGGAVVSVVIENDFRDRAQLLPPLTDHSADTILRRIAEAGIVGMGGAAFPTAAKAGGARGKIDTLIANGCECEPYITADDVLMTTATREVLHGLDLLRRALGPERTVLAVEDNKKTAIECLRRSVSDYPAIELLVLPTRYPQGSEKQLIRAVTGREAAAGQLPHQVGCAVFNVSTCAAVFRAVEEGKALTARIVTVSGEAAAKPGNYLVPLGTSFRDLLTAAGDLGVSAHRVLSGGPMMGLAQTDLAVSVVKATNAVVCLRRQEGGTGERCIRCGRCVGACPMHLQPLYLYHYQRDAAALERLHLFDCIECGCCSYICPARLPLVERFRAAKRWRKEAGA